MIVSTSLSNWSFLTIFFQNMIHSTGHHALIFDNLNPCKRILNNTTDSSFPFNPAFFYYVQKLLTNY